MLRRMTSWIWLALLVPLWFAASIDRAAAGVLYTYVGTITHIEYNNVDPAQDWPYALGAPVVAQIYIPSLRSGFFSVTPGVLYVDNGTGPIGYTSPPEFFFGYITFGLPGNTTIPFAFTDGGDSSGQFGQSSMPLIERASFCCVFPESNPAFENGDALITGNDFFSHYFPTGQGEINITAYGTGRWTARFIPEPASVAVFSIALIGLAAAARRRIART